MISVAPKDRDALRFLWVTNIDSDDREIIALTFARVVFSVSSCPLCKFPEAVPLKNIKASKIVSSLVKFSPLLGYLCLFSVTRGQISCLASRNR